jgi:uncharacterized protein YjdB
MKLKKIISLLAVASIVATTSITSFAAISIDDDNVIDQSSFDTTDQIGQRVPTLDLKVTQLTTKTEVKAATTTAFANQNSVDTYDLYQIDITSGNMGELVNGYDEDYNRIYSGVSGITVAFDTQAFATKYAKTTQLTGGTVSLGLDNQTKIFNVLWQTSDVQNPFPYFNEDEDEIVYSENGEFTISIVVGVTKGTSVTVPVNLIVNYDQMLDIVKNTNAAQYTLTLGEEETTDPTVANLELDKTSVDLDLNGTTSATVKATVTMDPADAEEAAVEWTSNNNDVATVEDGVITAKAVGDATITATAGDHSVEVAVKVVDTTPVGPTVLQEGDQFPDSVVVAAAKEGNVLTYVKTVSAGVSATKHAKLTNKTKGESIVTERNIAQLLGGEAEDGATIEGAIVVVVSGAEGDEFDFEIVD